MIKSALFATLLTACALASAGNNPLFNPGGNHSPAPSVDEGVVAVYNEAHNPLLRPITDEVTTAAFGASFLLASNPLYVGGDHSPAPVEETL